jgi:hypothetical protein
MLSSFRSRRASPTGNASALAHAQVLFEDGSVFRIKDGGEDVVVDYSTSLHSVISYVVHCYTSFSSLY